VSNQLIVLPSRISRPNNWLDGIIREKAARQADELRHVADFIERHGLTDTNIALSFSGPVVAVCGRRAFDQLMLGRQMKLTPTRGCMYYDADGEIEGIAIRCYSYRLAPKSWTAPLLCICGEPEVATEGAQ
jgi:hypothetical protein